MSKLRKKMVYRLLIWLGPWLIRLLGCTLRIQRINYQATDELFQQKQAYILCPWHGRLFLPVFCHQHQSIVAMVSQHADGELITRIIKKLGYDTVRGSSTRGGKKAFLQLLSHLKNSGWGAMIPDGPTGPRYYLKPGTLLLAQQAQCHLIPITFAARPCWRFKSWDHMVLPRPFARAVLVYGDPLRLPTATTAEELETWRQKIETLMLELVRTAEAHFGGGDPDFEEKTNS